MMLYDNSSLCRLYNFMVASEEQIKRQIEQSRVMLAHQVESKSILRAHDTFMCDCMPVQKVTSCSVLSLRSSFSLCIPTRGRHYTVLLN